MQFVWAAEWAAEEGNQAIWSLTVCGAAKLFFASSLVTATDIVSISQPPDQLRYLSFVETLVAR